MNESLAFSWVFDTTTEPAKQAAVGPVPPAKKPVDPTAQYIDYVKNIPYAGASSNGFDAKRWMASKLSADAALNYGESHDKIRQRSRQLYRSNPIGGVIDQDADLVVGTGFTPQSKIIPMAGVVTERQAKKYNEQLEAIGESIWPRIDINGKDSVWEVTRLVQRNIRTDGEALVIMSDKERKRGKVPLVLEVIDVDRLETPPEEIGNPLCRFGVLKDKDGEITHYYIRDTHPGDDKLINMKYTKVPADRVCHIFERWFAGQSRGLAWFTRALHQILDSEDLTDAGLIAAQVEACYVGAITMQQQSNLTPEQVANNIASAVEFGKKLKDMQPGTMPVLPPGAGIVFGQPPHGNNTVPSLQELNYRRIAGALNTAYEMLLKDWRGVSYSGGRLVLQGIRQDVLSRQKRLMESFLGKVWARMVWEAVIMGRIGISPVIYEQWPEVFERHKWMPPAWGFAINPVVEVQAAVLAKNENMTTAAANTASYCGEDFEALIEERAAERELERLRNVVPPATSAAEAKMLSRSQTISADGGTA